jgi:hypothetical protein
MRAIATAWGLLWGKLRALGGAGAAEHDAGFVEARDMAGQRPLRATG